VTAPACRVRDGVINTVFRPADDHRAAAVAHDINGDLPTHDGTVADNNDLLGLKMHIRGAFVVLLKRLRLNRRSSYRRRVTPSAGAPRKRGDNPARFWSF